LTALARASLFLPQFLLHFAQQGQIDEPVQGNVRALSGLLSDSFDNGFQHRFLDVAVGVDNLLENFERVRGDAWLQAEIFLQIRDHLRSFFTS
jgi:hypothetical protein